MSGDIVTPENLLKAHEIAVEAKVKADAHIQDCTMFRLRLAEDFKDVKETVRGNREEAARDVENAKNDLKQTMEANRLQTAQATDKLSIEQKKQTWILALIVGGIIALSHLPDLWHLIHP